MKVYIETERLILREWQPEDLYPFIEINRNPEVMEFFLQTLSENESKDFYDRIIHEFETSGFGLYAVEIKADHRFIGYVGFHQTTFKTSFSPCIEIAWRLCTDAWGHGLATEAASACLRYGFDQLHLDRIYSFTAIPNKRSERVMQKIGMQKCGEFDHPAVEPAHPLLRHVLYEITPDKL